MGDKGEMESKLLLGDCALYAFRHDGQKMRRVYHRQTNGRIVDWKPTESRSSDVYFNAPSCRPYSHRGLDLFAWLLAFFTFPS